MLTITQIVSADISSIGRVDISSLPEQSLMELLVADIANLQELQNANGTFAEIKNWYDVSFDEEGHVIEIDFEPESGFDFHDYDEDLPDDYTIGPGGAIDLCFTPPHVHTIRIPKLKLQGTVDTAALPLNLKRLNIHNNRFSSTFDIAHLPRTMVNIDISHNHFEGTLNVPALPRPVVQFRAGRNDFCGEIDLRGLPSCMMIFEIRYAKLSGSIVIENLPERLVLLDIRNNNIAQQRLVIDRLSYKFGLDKENFGEIVDLEGKNIKAFLLGNDRN